MPDTLTVRELSEIRARASAADVPRLLETVQLLRAAVNTATLEWYNFGGVDHMPGINAIRAIAHLTPLPYD